MDILLKALKKSIQHLEVLDSNFSTFSYPEKNEYIRNRKKIKELNSAFSEPFTNELYYGDDGRQMILNDILEYNFSARGYFYMWRSTDIFENMRMSLIESKERLGEKQLEDSKKEEKEL